MSCATNGWPRRSGSPRSRLQSPVRPGGRGRTERQVCDLKPTRRRTARPHRAHGRLRGDVVRTVSILHRACDLPGQGVTALLGFSSLHGCCH